MSLESFLSLCTGLTKLEKLIYFSRSFSIGFNTLLFLLLLLPLLILQFHPPICNVLHCPRWQNFSRMFCIRKQNLTLTSILVKCWGVIALQGRHRSQHLQSCNDTYCCSFKGRVQNPQSRKSSVKGVPPPLPSPGPPEQIRQT